MKTFTYDIPDLQKSIKTWDTISSFTQKEIDKINLYHSSLLKACCDRVELDDWSSFYLSDKYFTQIYNILKPYTINFPLLIEQLVNDNSIPEEIVDQLKEISKQAKQLKKKFAASKKTYLNSIQTYQILFHSKYIVYK